MQITRTIFLGMVLFAATLAVVGQENPSPPGGGGKPPKPTGGTVPCTLELRSLPTFAGVRVGMSYEDVAAVYPGIETNKHFHRTFDTDGSGSFVVESKTVDSPATEDFTQIDLGFEDRAVRGVGLHYAQDKWTSIRDAVFDLSRRIGVDEEAWEIHYEQSAILKCKDFTFYANSLSHAPPRINSMSIHPKVDPPK